uniref:Uncharacterized protein n=1 Tax=Arundo donax TaxID=35708 RepID=A0A0A9A7X4_ARUDO
MPTVAEAPRWSPHSPRPRPSTAAYRRLACCRSSRHQPLGGGPRQR